RKPRNQRQYSNTLDDCRRRWQIIKPSKPDEYQTYHNWDHLKYEKHNEHNLSNPPTLPNGFPKPLPQPHRLSNATHYEHHKTSQKQKKQTNPKQQKNKK